MKQESEFDSVSIDTTPTSLSTQAAIAAAIVAALTSAPFALLALPLGLAGVATIAASLLVVGRRRWVTLGAGALFLAILVSGGFGTPVELLLVSTVATVLAWDFGQNAISLGRHVGRHSPTRRNELFHGAFTAVVSGLAAAVGYTAYLVSDAGRSIAALAFLLLGVVFLVWGIRT